MILADSNGVEGGRNILGLRQGWVVLQRSSRGVEIAVGSRGPRKVRPPLS